jgi:hypothetical protein
VRPTPYPSRPGRNERGVRVSAPQRPTAVSHQPWSPERTTADSGAPKAQTCGGGWELRGPGGGEGREWKGEPSSMETTEGAIGVTPPPPLTAASMTFSASWKALPPSSHFAAAEAAGRYSQATWGARRSRLGVPPCCSAGNMQRYGIPR